MTIRSLTKEDLLPVSELIREQQKLHEENEALQKLHHVCYVSVRDIRENKRLQKYLKKCQCPECGSDILRFVFDHGDIGTGVDVECRKCDWTEDLTEYEVW